jgi:hypothetical protein
MLFVQRISRSLMRPFMTVCWKLFFFYHEGLLTPRPTPRLPLMSCLWLFIQYICSHPPYLKAISAFLKQRMCNVVASSSPPNVVCTDPLYFSYILANSECAYLMVAERPKYAAHNVQCVYTEVVLMKINMITMETLAMYHIYMYTSVKWGTR